MKKILIVATAFIFGIVLGINVFLAHIYSRAGIVTELLHETDEVVWDDGYYYWKIEGIDDWMVGDGITVINFDCFTTSIEDDITIEYRYN